ncbi:hypothetical protein ACH5RR_013113 [Cinchona calisaya]|uniref:Uncharacterized protein n=1 Tax=Cinchona calisaya TaxID=153742 RepID=A0ABD3A1B1_9GENT
MDENFQARVLRSSYTEMQRFATDDSPNTHLVENIEDDGVETSFQQAHSATKDAATSSHMVDAATAVRDLDDETAALELDAFVAAAPSDYTVGDAAAGKAITKAAAAPERTTYAAVHDLVEDDNRIRELTIDTIVCSAVVREIGVDVARACTIDVASAQENIIDLGATQGFDIDAPSPREATRDVII